MKTKKFNPEILEGMPPADLEAEKCLLGSIMQKSEMLDEILSIVNEADFYAESHQTIFRLFAEMVDNRIPLDSMTIIDHLKQIQHYESIGGVTYLSEIGQSVPWAANALHYARIVARKSKYRKIIRATEEALRDAYAEADAPDEIISQTEKYLGEIRTDESRGIELITAHDAAIAVIERIEAICDRQEHLGLCTGFEIFDEHIGGLFPGELIILAARPGQGKTALACQIANHASNVGKLVYYASLEMSGPELAQRSICGMAGVSSKLVRTGQIDESAKKLLCNAANAYGRRNLKIDCRSALKIFDIRRSARRLKKDGLKLVVVDYLQLITPTDKKSIREQQVAEMSRALKELARELNVPVLCLSQLNRAAEQQDRPTMSNLRESGAIEQDADMVLFIHRPINGIQIKKAEQNGNRTRWVTEKAEWPAELILEKNRNGESHTFKLDWLPQQTQFDTWEKSSNYIPAGYHNEFSEYS